MLSTERLIGDLVKFDGNRWVVSQQHAGTRTLILRQLDGRSVEIANDDPRCEAIVNLPTKWPFIALRRKKSRIERITITRTKTSLLRPMMGWVPADPLHCGGVIYFNPALHLRPGEVLVAYHQDGTTTRINVTKSFGTVQRKIDLAESKQSKQSLSMPNRYDILLEDD